MRLDMEPGARHDIARTNEKLSRHRNRKTWIKDLTYFIVSERQTHLAQRQPVRYW